jgi:hypothetical protein
LLCADFKTNHIGFYPTGSGIENFKHELATYKTSKGTIQFSLDQPLPFDLITEIVKFRIAENLEKSKEKRKKKFFAESSVPVAERSPDISIEFTIQKETASARRQSLSDYILYQFIS